MTVETYPGLIQGRTYTAEIVRRLFGSLLKRGASVGSIAGGLVHEGDCKISYTGTELKVQVAPGECWVPGSSVATQSGYYLRVSAAETLTPNAVGGTVRVDAIVARVKDKAYTGTEDEGVLEVLKGTAKGGANLTNLEGAPGQSGGPALPVSCFVLGYALIPASGTAVTVSNTAEVFQPGGQRYEEDTAAKRPTSSTASPGVRGRIFRATDTEAVSLDIGTGWKTIWTPAFVTQESSAPQAFLSWGVISSTGTIEGGSGDFTVVKTGTGQYEIKWTVAKASAKYAVVVTSKSAQYASAAAATTAHFGAFFFEGSSPATPAEGFSFVAVATS